MATRLGRFEMPKQVVKDEEFRHQRMENFMQNL